MPGLRRAQRLRKASEFAAVRAQGRTVHGPSLALGWCPNSLPYPQFGFVVGKRVGNAVTRNLVKRRLRSLAQQVRPQLATGFALVITAKAGAAQRSFDDLHAELRGLLRRAKLWQNSDATNPATAQLPAPHHGVITDP